MDDLALDLRNFLQSLNPTLVGGLDLQGAPWIRPWQRLHDDITPLKLDMGAGVSLLPNKSTITLRTASGDIIDERCGLPREVIVTCKSSKPINAKGLTEVWSREFSAVMRIPLNECISFTWSKDGHLSYNVLVVFIPLTYESAGYILSRALWPRCRVCTMALRPWGRMTWCDRNCSACDRPDCCGRCKVKLTGGAVKCYDCLTEEEYEQAKEMYSGGLRHPAESLRLSLLRCSAAGSMSMLVHRGAVLRPRHQRGAMDDEASAPTRGH